MVSLMTLPLSINSIRIHRYNFITLDINNLYSQQSYSPCPEYKLVSPKNTLSNNQTTGPILRVMENNFWNKMGLNLQATPRPVHQPALPVVLLQGPEHAGQYRVQVLLREPQQAGLPVLGGDEASPLLGARGQGDWDWVDEGGHRDDLLQGHQGLGGKLYSRRIRRRNKPFLSLKGYRTLMYAWFLQVFFLA